MTWEVTKDDEGDIVLSCNGEPVLWVDLREGRVFRNYLLATNDVISGFYINLEELSS